MKSTDIDDILASVPLDSRPRTDQYDTPEFRAVEDRRHKLIGRKYRIGLLDEERTELEALTIRSRAFDRPFYAPILRRLRRVVEIAKERAALE